MIMTTPNTNLRQMSAPTNNAAGLAQGHAPVVWTEEYVLRTLIEGIVDDPSYRSPVKQHGELGELGELEAPGAPNPPRVRAKRERQDAMSLETEGSSSTCSRRLSLPN